MQHLVLQVYCSPLDVYRVYLPVIIWKGSFPYYIQNIMLALAIIICEGNWLYFEWGRPESKFPILPCPFPSESAFPFQTLQEKLQSSNLDPREIAIAMEGQVRSAFLPGFICFGGSWPPSLLPLL